MQTASTQLIGSRYQIVKKLGGGGQKSVYLAEDLRLNRRQCALAEMVDSFDDAQERQRAIADFEHEADMLASLRDEHIPQIYDKFSEGQNHYLVMEFVDGNTLEAKLREASGSILPELEVVDIALQILETLEYLHGLSPPVIYRDMKPGNVMVTLAGKVRLIDFGIARFFRSTRTRAFGTEGYAPKEQYSGIIEQRSDVYALGAMLHEALSGRVPIPFDFPPLVQLRPSCNVALSNLIAKALADDIKDRVASAREFRTTLLEIKGALANPSAASFNQSTAGNSDDRTVPLRKLTTQADSETLILSGTADEKTAILAGGEPAASDAITKRNIDTLKYQISGKTDDRERNDRRRRPRALIAAACAGGLVLAAGSGFFVWSQLQTQKAVLAAHEKAMEQIDEQEHALAEQQRLAAIQRQQELQRQEALRQQQLQQQQEALREQAQRLRRQQEQDARRERQLHQPPAGAYAGYPNSGYSYPAGYPRPSAATTPAQDLSGAVATGLSAAIGGALGSSLGHMLGGSSSGSVPAYSPPSYPPAYSPPRRSTH
jgi:serine/threonine protein kinase